MRKILDYGTCKEKTFEERLNILIESSPVSSFVDWQQTTQRIRHKRNLNYTELEQKLKQIFKVLKSDIFIDNKDKFKKIRDKLLAKKPINEDTKLKRFLTNEIKLEENCLTIKELLND
jgi:hypothetical protein